MKLLTTTEAAELLGVSGRSVLDLVKTGKLAVHRLGPHGGKTRFTEEDLAEYLRSIRSFGSRAPSPPSASPRRGKRSALTKSTGPGVRGASKPAANRRPPAKPVSQTARGNSGK